MSAKKILMVLTSHDQLGDTGHKTGFWVEEFAAPYYAFIDAGVEVTLASVKGGQPPVDPNSAALWHAYSGLKKQTVTRVCSKSPYS